MSFLPIEIEQRHELYNLLQEKIRRQPTIELFQKQLDILACPDRRIALNVGRRGGKTEALCYILATQAVNYPNQNLLFVAKSQDSARSIVWIKFTRMLGGKPGITFNSHEYRIVFSNGSVIRLAGADKDPDVLRGQAYHRVVVDEAAFIRDLDYLLQEVLEPALLDYGGTLYIASSPYGLNRFHEICHNAAWKLFHWTAYDNPFIKRKELDRIKLQYGEQSIIWQQEYMGQFVRHDGLIFKNFRTEAPYVINPTKLLPQWKKLLIIDPGSTAPTGYVILAHDPMLDRLYAVRAQNKKTGGNIDPIARMLQLDLIDYPNATVICDGHASNVIAELRNRYAIPVVAWTRKDVMGSYARLISRMERGSFQIFGGNGSQDGPCKDLELEILEAEWSPTRDPHDESGKVLGSDHCLDAVRYGNEFLYHREQDKKTVDDGLTEHERWLIRKAQGQKEGWWTDDDR